MGASLLALAKSIYIIILGYGCVSAEVHLRLITHKRTVMPHYKKTEVLCRCKCINSSNERSLLQIL